MFDDSEYETKTTWTPVLDVVREAVETIRERALDDHDTGEPGAALREGRWLHCLDLACQLRYAVEMAERLD